MWPLWIIILLAIGAFVIVVENLTVIFMVIFNKKLRSFTNGFIVSLAFSDVLVGGVFMPAYLVSPGLGANGYLVAIIMYTNVSNICAVTTERYIAIMKPLQYGKIMAKNFVYIVVASWVIPISISLLPLAWEENASATIHKVYVGFLISVCTLIPCIYVVSVYCVVFYEVRRQINWLNEQNDGSGENSGQKRINKEGKIALMFAIIAGIFVASWTPTIYMTSVHTLADRSDLIPESLLVISVFLIELSAATNAVVYSLYKLDFRFVINKVLGRTANIPGISDDEEKTDALTLA